MPLLDTSTIQRPQRWDVPFSSVMSDADVDRVLAMSPFSRLDPNRFSSKISLRGILQNDCRLVRSQPGDIVIRRGDWGNSAFFIQSGSVRVELEAEENPLPMAMLGRLETKRKTLFQSIAQLWRNHRQPEVRDVQQERLDSRIARAGHGENARIYLQDVPAVLERYKTTKIAAGHFFGELAALGRMPRSATVFADGETELLEIRWQGLRDILRKDDELRSQIDDNFRRHGLTTFLRNASLFQHLTDQQMEGLVATAKLETFGRYDSVGTFKQIADQGVAAGLENEPLIAAEGDYPNGVVLIRSGLARLSRRYHNGHRTVGYLTPGQVYGLDDVAAGWRKSEPQPQANSLRAIGFLTAVVVPTSVVEQLVFEKAGVPAWIGPSGDRRTEVGDRRSEVEGRRSETAPLHHSITPPLITHHSPPTAPIDTELVEFLVERRFINGTATMMIDLDRCTRCDDCVRACAAAHDGNPRFLRSGPVHGQYMVANACMHCSDPVCMIECPTGAIHRDLHEGRVVINDATCIGCSACAKNCPHDAIRMVDIRDKDGGFIRDAVTAQPIQKATKCDLCIDQLGGPACQRACPHDALVRVDMRDVETLGEWFRR
jgi:Fe-S-cluster-containing dehydrogenase component/CRP-like cAMP-binding protein